MDRNHQSGLIPISLIAYGLAAVAVLGALGYIAHSIRESGYQQAKAECQQAAQAQREAEAKQAAAAATGLEVKREKAKVVYRTITEKVNVEVEKPVYRNICIEPDGLLLANAALAGKSPDPAQSGPTVPAANAALRRSGGNSAAKSN